MSDRLSRRLIICFVLCAVSLSIFFLIQIANFPLISDDFDLGINGGNFKERLNQLDNPSYARGPFFFVILLNLFFHNDTFEIPHVIIGLMHLLVCTGFILLARKMWSHAHFISIGLMAVYLFINPLTNQSTMWILQSYPIFTLLFGVYAALSIIQYKLTARRSWYYLYCTLASLSILCNEQGLLMLPLYLYVNYYFGSSSYKNKAYAWFKSGLPFFVGWLIPYVIYRILLRVFFNGSSAISIYERHYSTILKTYPILIERLIQCLPISVFVVLGLILIANIKFLNEKKAVKWRAIGISVLFIFFLLSPFSLLNGYLSDRFFYVSSMILIFCVFWFFNRLLDFLSERKYIFNAIVVLLFVSMLGSTIGYIRDTLLPIPNMNKYVSRFIEQRKNLPADSLILLDVKEPAYKLPKNWLGTYAFRDKWSMIQINSIYGGNTQLVQSYSLQGDTIYSPLASYFLTLDELKKNKKNIFLYEYNGDKLSKVDGSEIVFLENERPVFKAILN